MSGIDIHACGLSEDVLERLENQHDLFAGGANTDSSSEDPSFLTADLLKTSISTSKVISDGELDPTLPEDDSVVLTPEVALISSFQRELALSIERMLDPDARGEIILMTRSEADGLQFKVILADDPEFDVLNLPSDLEMIVIDAYHPLTGEAYKKNFHVISGQVHTFFEQ